jgi:NAD(P)-dependent dehydrogenase (short-subunit alcohol dehydrogenase family)
VALEGRTAVITGAASGIGRGIALALAKRGCHLALADVNWAGLSETAAKAGAKRLRVTTHRLDVADRAAVGAFPERVLASHPSVDLLFNNAGVALGGTFEQVSQEDFDWLMAINFGGVVAMTRAFLPVLRANGGGRIVNVSSVYGLIAPPGQTAYAASKFAVRGFSESLRRELEGTGLEVSLVHPGGVATSVAANARRASALSAEDLAKGQERMKKLLRMPPDEAGEIIVRGVERGRPRIIVGRDAKFLAILERLAPVSYWKLLAKRYG